MIAVAVAAPASAIGGGERLTPTPTTEATAKAVAPLSIPTIPGVARRLRASVCIRQPESANAAPVATPATRRTRRNSCTTNTFIGSP